MHLFNKYICACYLQLLSRGGGNLATTNLIEGCATATTAVPAQIFFPTGKSGRNFPQGTRSQEISGCSCKHLFFKHALNFLWNIAVYFFDMSVSRFVLWMLGKCLIKKTSSLKCECDIKIMWTERGTMKTLITFTLISTVQSCMIYS